jgi:hypothetical protein
MSATAQYLPANMVTSPVASIHAAKQHWTGEASVEQVLQEFLRVNRAERPTLRAITVSPLLAIMDGVANLPDGWYGGGSKRISREVIERTRKIVSMISATPGMADPELTPNPNGTISLEWESPMGEVYLEIGKTRMNGFYQIIGSGPMTIPDMPLATPTFLGSINELLYPAQIQPVSYRQSTLDAEYPMVSALTDF